MLRDHQLLLPWKHLLLSEIHRAWLPGLTACPLCGSVLCLSCSICLLYRLPGSAPLSLLIALPERFPSILLQVSVPPHLCSEYKILGFVFIHHLSLSSFPHIHIHPCSHPPSLSLFPPSCICSASLKRHFNYSTCEKP